jgi:hypothetical protein
MFVIVSYEFSEKDLCPTSILFYYDCSIKSSSSTSAVQGVVHKLCIMCTLRLRLTYAC